MQIKTAIFALLLCCLTPVLSGEEPSHIPSGEEKDLTEKTLEMDINTAGYYELLSWCRELGIEESGEAQVLRKRLLDYYEITPTTEKKTDGQRQIDIQNSRQAQYFTDKEREESYIFLDGGVEVLVKDASSLHVIRAHRIIVNETKNILTAEGRVEYRKSQDGKDPEIYQGETLTFNLKTSEGIFYKAVGQNSGKSTGEGASSQDDGASPLSNDMGDFYFTGEKIRRLEDDVIILENGAITSSGSLDNPNWKIKASKIWVLGNNEWSIRDATLYVGELPMLYLPMYFKPGDRLFFNPVLGQRTREGQFLQTTTYLIGEKEIKESSNSFSIMDISPEDAGYYKLERRGVFEHKVKQDSPEVKDKDQYMKLMIDYYARLGFFTGLDWKQGSIFSLIGGLAVSRTVTPGGVYLFGSEMLSDWNSTRILGIDIPLRYSLESQFSTTLGKLSFQGKINFVSDPSFGDDFYNRLEDMDLFDLVFPEDSTGTGTTTSSTTVSDFDWTLSVKWSPDVSKTKPLLSSLRLDFLNTSYERKTTKNTTPGINEDAPEYTFLYPEKLKFPEAKVSLTGTLYSSAKNVEKEKPPVKTPDPGKGFRSFELLPTPSPGEEKEIEFRIGEKKSDFPVEQPQIPQSSLELTYSLIPNMVMESFFVHHDKDLLPATPEEVSHQILYTSMRDQIPLTLSWNGRWKNWLKSTGSLKINKEDKYVFNKGDQLAWGTYNEYLQDARENTKVEEILNMNLGITPLEAVRPWKGSGFTYLLNWKVHEYYCPEGSTQYDSVLFNIDKSHISTHSLNGKAVYNPGEKPYTLSVNNALHPLAGNLNFSLNFPLWQFSNTISSAYKQVDGLSWVENGEGEFDPFALSSSLVMDDLLSFTEKVTYDIEPDENTGKRGNFVSNFATLDLFKLNNAWLLHQEFVYDFEEQIPQLWRSSLGYKNQKLEFLMQKLAPKEFNLSTLTWTATGAPDRFTPSSLVLSLNLLSDSFYFWKNRISLSGKVTTNSTLDFYTVDKSNMRINFELNFNIYRFWTMTFKLNSYNYRLYQYFGGMADKVGVEPVNLFTDLLDSFNVFDTDALVRTSFNMESLSLTLTHQMDDWEFLVDFQGDLAPSADKTKQVFVPSLTLAVNWHAIPEVKKEIFYKRDTLDESQMALDIRG